MVRGANIARDKLMMQNLESFHTLVIVMHCGLFTGSSFRREHPRARKRCATTSRNDAVLNQWLVPRTAPLLQRLFIHLSQVWLC